MKPKEYLKWILRSVLLVGAVIGLYLGMFPDKFYKLTFYTFQSNTLVFLFYLFLLIQMFRNGKKSKINEYYRFKACVTINITLTFLVYAILLAPSVSLEKMFTANNLLLHYIVPLLCIVDWLIFDESGKYKITDPILWSVFPIVYCIFALLKGIVFRVPIPDEKNSPFPYFFLNIDRIGWGGFFKYLIIILTAYILIGYGMLLLKKKRHRAIF
jgi:hypothetical protein